MREDIAHRVIGTCWLAISNTALNGYDFGNAWHVHIVSRCVVWHLPRLIFAFQSTLELCVFYIVNKR